VACSVEPDNQAASPITVSKHVHSIGTVRNDIEGSEHPDWSAQESDLVIDPRWTEALEGLEHLDRLVVLWWFHKREGEEVPFKVHPKKDPERPLTGLFATRAPIRPNLIAMTSVEVLDRHANVVRVRGLDAFNGSPILDLKPG